MYLWAPAAPVCHSSRSLQEWASGARKRFQFGLEVFSRCLALNVIQNHCVTAISARQESRKNFMEFEDAT